MQESVRQSPLRDWIVARAPTDDIAPSVIAIQDKLLRLFESIDDARASAKPAGGAWSLRELLRHTIDAEERVTNQIESLTRGEEPSDYNVPDGVEMQIEDHGEPFAAFTERLRKAHAAFRTALTQLPDAGPTSSHGYFGPFTARQWVAFEEWHDTDHLKHARTILEATADHPTP